MTEEWRPVEGFEGYEVSDLGNVRSFRVKGSKFGGLSTEPRLLKLQDNGNGYLFVWLSVNGKRTKSLVHRLVAKAFLEPSSKPEVAHWDGVRDNNVPANLRWATTRENSVDRRRHGTHGCRLTKNEVLAIRETYELGFVTQQRVADQFGCSQAQVGRIIRKETWSHLV